MRRIQVPLLATVVLGGVGSAQTPQWVRFDNASGFLPYYFSIAPIGDFDGDGHGDLAFAYRPPQGQGIDQLLILSGSTGSTIWPPAGVASPPTNWVRRAGDVDGDGSPDVVHVVLRPASHHVLEVYSPAQQQVLWRTPPISGELGGIWSTQRVAGNLDVDGDGRSEIVALTNSPTESDVYVFNSDGTLRYTLPAFANGWLCESVAAMPDLDGDGGDDFVVGAHQLFRGGIGGGFAVSGRTGRILHFSSGLLPTDVLSGAICDAGDVDGDGIHDYAAGTYIFEPATRTGLFSGATGAMIRAYPFGSSDDSVIGNVDADLDGVPDLILGDAGWPVGPILFGEIRCYSGRDGSILWRHSSTSASDPVRPKTTVVNLGVQPGSPYPVFAWLQRDYQGQGRIVAMRTDLRGAGPVLGVPAASIGDLPQIGMRSVGAAPLTNIRIHTASGPPGALAILMLAGASDTGIGGVTVPLALDPFGLPGVTLYVPPILTVTTQLDATGIGSAGIGNGYGAIDLPIPTLNPNGIPFAAQWLLLDPPTGAFATTARHEFRVF
ncbi:MAG: FG-GAP-like repeat-containing protein [Planctomycetota bacterium]